MTDELIEPELPVRVPFTGPPADYTGAPIETVEAVAEAIREWAERS
ncbi:hypothetical protein AB0M45_18115 [Nocardia sp. NPDC051787]